MTEQEKQAWYEMVLARANQAGAYAAVGGMQVVAVGDGWARSELQLTTQHWNPMGIVHGGVYCTMMDQAAGTAACSRGSFCRTINWRCVWGKPSTSSGRGWRMKTARCALTAYTPSA